MGSPCVRLKSTIMVSCPGEFAATARTSVYLCIYIYVSDLFSDFGSKIGQC